MPNHYWVKYGPALEETCPVCKAPYMEPCLTNKNLPHKQGYVHRAREAAYMTHLKDLVLAQETRHREVVV